LLVDALGLNVAIVVALTLGKTRTQETRNLLDESLGSDEGIVLACELLDQLLVLVELSQVLSGHGINTEVLGTIDIVLVTENAVIVRQPSCSLILFQISESYQMAMLGRGTLGSLTVPEKRLSRWGS
jgi:ACT domain-containing protein